ncbi:MAG: DNA polymerase III subunit gamma/tau [Chloroflexi bacterium]|nr:DNA polymerase III subunit gamma/tau [Chloroflexota bacterium]
MFDDQLPPPDSSPQPTTVDRRALYLRRRPKLFEEVVGQEHVTRTLKNAVKLGRPSHAYLFTGPRGTGKTSVARILYRAVNCDQLTDAGDPCNACLLCTGALSNRALDLIEIDAASNRGIDDMRDLRDKVAYRPGEGRYKVYIIDEAHELTPQAWDAFLKTLEEPPPHAIFVLATTEAHKVPPTIISRCQRFDFRRIPFQPTRDLLVQVAALEGMQVEPAVVERLALVARGGLRDALGLLDQLAAFAGGYVDMAVARAALSLPSIEAVRGVLDGLTRHDPSTVMAVISDAAEGGADLRLFAEELVVHLRALLLLRTGADVRLTDELPDAEVAWLRERAPAWSVGTLMRLVQTLSDALARTRDAQQFQVQTEVALLTACDVEGLAPPPVAFAPAAARGQSSTPIDDEDGGDHDDPEATAVPARGDAPGPSASTRAPDGSAPVVAAPARVPDGGSPAAQAAVVAADGALKLRWPDVVEQVKTRNSLLGSTLGSAHPLRLEKNVLIVAFATEFNRKTADKTTSRQLIETAFGRVYGTAYRLRCIVSSPAEAGVGGLLDDPVINYATRTFGGQPKRVISD